jgi:hypothetical protein
MLICPPQTIDNGQQILLKCFPNGICELDHAKNIDYIVNKEIMNKIIHNK